MPTKSRAPKPKQKDPLRTQEDLLAAAERLFSEHGPEGTSIRQVAAAAGCNVSLISYYFGGKEGLLQALLTRHFSRSGENLVSDEALLAEHWPELRSPLERRVASLLFAVATNMVAHPRMQRIVFREMMCGSERIVSALVKTQKSATSELRHEIETRIKDGEFHPKLDLRYALLMAISPLVYSCLAQPLVKGIYGFKKIDRDYMRDFCVQLARTLVHGWRAKP